MPPAETERRRLVLIGLDAFDPALARRWAAAGELPTLARLFGRGSRCAVHNPFGLFVGSLWVSFASALRPERHGFHCWDEIDPATYRWRLNPPAPERYRAFWNRIGHAGRRIVAIDVPHARAAERVNGLELFEWGCHDRHFGLHSAPPEQARALAERFGLHPGLGADPWRAREFAADDFVARRRRLRTAAEDRALVRRMVEGAAAKGRLVEALVREEDWDLFVAVFGEAHAIGHQQWHLHDESHPRFDAAARAAVGGDPVLQVYRAIDAALGRVVAAAPPDAALLVHLSHGMGPHYDGTHLLDEVLLRLDRTANGRRPSGPAAAARQALKPLMPALRQAAERLRVPPALTTALAQLLRGDRPGMRARRRFYATPNNSVYGGIRLNLIGREGRGKVAAEEAEAVCGLLERGLLELVNADTGLPAVRAVHRADRHHRRRADDRMPDLFVEWERSAPIDAVRSARIGTVRTRYTHWRTGDHLPDGLLIAAGAGLAAGVELPAVKVEDLGPSIAGRLGVAIADVDGEPVSWLVAEEGRAVRAAAEVAA